MHRWVIHIIPPLLLAIWLLAGCQVGPFLRDVTVRPATISPNADGQDDVAEIKYGLTRQSTVTIYFLDAAGQRHDFRVDKRRSQSKRTAYFSGVVDGRLLPDGAYTCVIEATDERGRKAAAEQPIQIVNGDKVPLEVMNLSIWPSKFTPNRDGITDRVTVSYSLSKPVATIDVYLRDAAGQKYPVPQDKIRKAGAAGAHEHDYDAGIDLGATPPKDGDYTLVVEAQDAVGNQAHVEGQLTIEGGGLPMVEIVNGAAEFSPSVVALGGTLSFTCTVRNIGTVPVRTKGPESGTIYSTGQNFNTLALYEEPGIFRIGLDFEGNSVGRKYPFRWELGTEDELATLQTDIGPQKYLMPGQTVTVAGRLRVDDKPSRVAPYYWIGLVQEQVAIVQDRIEPTSISIGF